MKNVNERFQVYIKNFKKIVVILTVLVTGLVVYVQFTWNTPGNRAVNQMTAPMDSQTIKRGEYLYEYTLACWFCHGYEGQRVPGAAQAGGAEFDATGIGPGFGFFYGSNVTPDPETGIGEWTDGELVRAIREGLDRDGRLIFPIMEAEWYQGISDEDMLALVAYMRTFTPVRNMVPKDKPSFAAKAMIDLDLIKAQPPITTQITAPPRGPTAEYGEYLATRASMCAGCHTPRSQNTGKYDMARIMGGSLFPILEEGYEAMGSNITPDKSTGIGNWSETQFITAMRTGLRPDGSVMLPFMPWPVYSRWIEDDLHAVWLYLRSLEPIEHEVPPSQLTGKMVTGNGSTLGEAVYTVYCITCHGDKGSGSLIASDALKEGVKVMQDTTLIEIISQGLDGTSMPGFGETLTNNQLEGLLEYIHGW